MNEEKLLLKLKMMEISFEQINDSRNDMIKQLANRELVLEKVANLWRTKPNHWVEQMYGLIT
jgi:hypothetical protein